MKQNSKTDESTVTRSQSLQTMCSRFGFGRSRVGTVVPPESYASLDMAVIVPDPDGGAPHIERTAYEPRPALILPNDPATLASFSRGDVEVHARKPQV